MKKLILIFIGTLFVHSSFAQITFFACPSSFTSSPNQYTLTLEGTDATGRNYYQTNPIDGAQSCNAGVCEFRIAWNSSSNRWEILLFQNNLDFSDALPVYYNTSASLPNPPSLNLGTWVDNYGVCDGALTTSNSILTGDVQDTTLGNEEVVLLDKQIYVYPNPANEKFYISSQVASIKSVKVYSQLGKLLATYHDEKEMNVSNLAKGLYLIKIKTKTNQQLLRKLLII